MYNIHSAHTSVWLIPKGSCRRQIKIVLRDLHGRFAWGKKAFIFGQPKVCCVLCHLFMVFVCMYVYFVVVFYKAVLGSSYKYGILMFCRTDCFYII